MHKIATRRYHKIATSYGISKICSQQLFVEVILKGTRSANENSWLNYGMREGTET